MSQTQIANFATAGGLIALILSQFGVVFPADKISFVLASLWSLGWTGYNYWQRYQKGDLTIGGRRI